ncbi:hypothetical protein [Ornithinibacillus hominis]|uniref:Lipoprotein n=1 Tax=Ornithinibacillus hominis TaxID=2763055 RepID=A0A923L5I1_9BACI|nr:hypothetical protein [Ornithinibacillus hominis]MBC5636839.1 hypothetical protein [Ornithinibacillus hominis]
MKMRVEGFIVLIIILVILAACSNSEEQTNGNESEEEIKTSEVEKIEEQEEEEQDSEKVSFEVKDTTAPEDQGDLNVWFEGDFHVVGDKVRVNGTTNLLPGSKLQLMTTPVAGTFIGGGAQGKVEESGAFELEANLPDDYEGILHIELTFKVGDQYTEELAEYYIEGIRGDFAQIYYDAFEEAMFDKASFAQIVVIDGSKQSFSITKPEWNIPDDLGSKHVRITPTLERQGDYIVLNIESNLLEEATIHARAEIPNYITSGFQGTSEVNPDGTAVIYIVDPEKDDRIKDLEEYEIVISFEPDNNQSINVVEAYGENGEELEGDLVVNTENGKNVVQRLSITVE